MFDNIGWLILSARCYHNCVIWVRLLSFFFSNNKNLITQCLGFTKFAGIRREVLRRFPQLWEQTVAYILNIGIRQLILDITNSNIVLAAGIFFVFFHTLLLTSTWTSAEHSTLKCFTNKLQMWPLMTYTEYKSVVLLVIYQQNGFVYFITRICVHAEADAF